MSSASKQQQQTRDLKHRILTCLHKLSDRDTHSAAATELEAIAAALTPATLPTFLSAISATDSTDRGPVRRHILRLISLLPSLHPATLLSPHLSKLLSAVSRRLRDHDSSVRHACASAAASLSSLSSSFPSLSKPFLDPLFTEQDPNSQSASALCLAAIVAGSRKPDPLTLRRLLPRLEKLVKHDGFKAKAALLGLIGNVVEVEGVLNGGGGGGGGKSGLVRNVVMCLVGFLGSEDWAARKGAAEALMKMAVVVEKDGGLLLSEYKVSCLKTFEAKRFDKVKAVRETMIKMIDAWKEIPDLPDEVSAPPESQASSKENASDGHYPPGSKTFTPATPQLKQRNPLDKRTPLSDSSSATKRTPITTNEKKTGPAMFRKLDRKKPSASKSEIGTPASFVSLDENRAEKDKFVKTEIRRALFNEKDDEKIGVFKAGSHVVPYGDDSGVVSNESGGPYRDRRESEELSLIRKQLAQIETQQSNLLDLIQKFMGSSQSGMNSLETRVHGLELALDEISFDLAVSTGRISQPGAGALCCKLPGADFLSSKLRKKTDARSSAPRLLAFHGTPSVAAVRNITSDNGSTESFQLVNRRFNPRAGHGFIVNPLAEISTSKASSSGVAKNISL